MGYYNNASIDTRTCGEADEDAARDRRDGSTLPAAHAVHDTSPVVAPTTPDSSDAGRQEADPRLILCAEDGQYWCWYDRQFVGTHPNYHAADLALDDYELSLFEDGLIDAPPRAYTYACVAELVEFIPGVISDAPADYPCPCELHGAHADNPNLATLASPGPDALVGASTAPSTAQERITGESLCYEFRTAPAAFLAQLGTFSDRARAAVNRAVAAYLERPIGDVVELWGESRAKLAELARIEEYCANEEEDLDDDTAQPAYAAMRDFAGALNYSDMESDHLS